MKHHLKRWLSAALLLLVSSCSDAVLEVPIEKLVAESERFHGHVLVVEATVHCFVDPLHHWLEDNQRNRVGVVPDDLLQDLVGQQVRVRGRFTAYPQQGRRIQLHQLIRLPAAENSTTKSNSRAQKAQSCVQLSSEPGVD
ncbi:MAG: hypothetical protein LAT66_15110 [Alkalimonas sp.]|nr:hypothetical protein [Alkalimonas sp.]